MKGASFYARYTLGYHLPAEVLLGLFSGVWMLADLLTRKTLGASKEILALRTSVPMMMLLLAMVWRDPWSGGAVATSCSSPGCSARAFSLPQPSSRVPAPFSPW